MAIASVPTKLPLATWARILGVHPLHFAQIEYTPNSRSAQVCDGAMAQYDWQKADQVGREQIAQAIQDAERMIENALGFRLIPTWEVDEWHNAARPYQRELVNYNGMSIPVYRSSVPAGWRKVISGGVEGKTLISASKPITWSDADGDGYSETGTVMATVAEGQPPCEIALYYPGKGAADRYEIRPITTTVAGSLATMTFRRELCVVEEILESLDVEPADATDDDDFLAEVDVYRHWNDPSTQATLMWEPGNGCVVCAGEGEGCGQCSYSVQSACLFLRSSPRVGHLGWTPGSWDPDEETFNPASIALGRSPDLVRLYYYAGHYMPTGCPREMDPHWARVVAYLSLSLIDRPACQCTSDIWDYWREIPDMGKSNAAVLKMSNPFGVTRGAMYAWDRVTDPNVAVTRSATLV